MPKVKCWQVDAFTDRPFSGNPAAVCWLEEPVSDKWMQSVANEMNLSETAFVQRNEQGLQLRWFTPEVEVDLCGHATLATAHALWSSNLVHRSAPLQFQTKSGVLSCTFRSPLIELDFPALPAALSPPEDDLLAALGLSDCVDFGRTRFDVLVAVQHAETVRRLQPDFGRLKQFPVRGVIVTAPSDDPKYDFVSRFFAPFVGVDEDPVCGSAHCCLATYWGRRLQKQQLVAFQASIRTGLLHLTWNGERVKLGGQAVTVWAGELQT